jgi:acyl carrier protein
METFAVNNDEMREDTVESVIRRTLAYAAGVRESELSAETKLHELNLDSMAVMAFGVVLEAELELEFSEEGLARLFALKNVEELVEAFRKDFGRDMI